MDDRPNEAWTTETMRVINEMTASITGKAFDPDWFLLRQRFQAMEDSLATERARYAELVAKARQALQWAVDNPDDPAYWLTQANAALAALGPQS